MKFSVSPAIILGGRPAVLFSTHTEAREACGDIYVCRLTNEDINTEHIQNCSESHFMSIWPFHLSKTILTQKSKGIHGNPSK